MYEMLLDFASLKTCVWGPALKIRCKGKSNPFKKIRDANLTAFK